jgi:hypothetical protein
MTLEECIALGGHWIPCARCSENACSICPFEDPDHCQLDYTDIGGDIVTIDYSLSSFSRWADDFRATSSGPIERVCWVPCFFNVTTGEVCHNNPPADDWWVRFYADDAGLPGAEIPPIGGQELVVDVAGDPISGMACAWRTAPVTDPPIVQDGECYWIEIMGFGNGVGGCNFYWRTAGDGNGYALNDRDGVWGPEDIVLEIDGDTNVDMSFCVDVGMVPNEGCGDIPGVCCTATQCVDANHDVCANTGECSGLIGELCNPLDLVPTCPAGETCVPSVFFPDETCAPPNPCTGPPENDDCENAIDVTAPGQPCENGAPCEFDTDNTLASQDVPGNTAGCVVYGDP